jgi:hypothetical protein
MIVVEPRGLVVSEDSSPAAGFSKWAVLIGERAQRRPAWCLSCFSWTSQRTARPYKLAQR